jgi:hypothetical protein
MAWTDPSTLIKAAYDPVTYEDWNALLDNFDYIFGGTTVGSYTFKSYIAGTGGAVSDSTLALDLNLKTSGGYALCRSLYLPTVPTPSSQLQGSAMIDMPLGGAPNPRLSLNLWKIDYDSGTTSLRFYFSYQHSADLSNTPTSPVSVTADDTWRNLFYQTDAGYYSSILVKSDGDTIQFQCATDAASGGTFAYLGIEAHVRDQ